MLYKYEYEGLKISIKSVWVPGEDRDYRRASVAIQDVNGDIFNTQIFGKDITISKRIFFNLIPIYDWRYETDDEFHSRVLKEAIADYRISSSIRKLPPGFIKEIGNEARS